jgi:hypothetical protein
MTVFERGPFWTPINLKKNVPGMQSLFAFLIFWEQKVLGSSELADIDLFSIHEALQYS